MIKINTNDANANKRFMLIPKYEEYSRYMLKNVLFYLSKTERFNIGNEFKVIMYRMLNNIMYLNKVSKERKMDYCNNIDAEINTQRSLLRIIYENRYIDRKKFEVSMSKLDEIGSILGVYIKSLGIKYE